MGYANTEYDTHYMNLAYTPQKALSLAIASRVFHKIPMGTDFGSYPTNIKFDDFSVNYEKDLAVYNGRDEFIYTNSNQIDPKSTKNLQHIAGFGDSKVVNYEGTGAYFLDKLKDGVWRLEVMPDAISVKNPLGENSPDKKVTVINWKTAKMEVKLADLGEKFSVKALNTGNTFTTETAVKSFNIRPGTYLLKSQNTSFEGKDSTALKNLYLKEFTAPETNVDQTYLKHEPVKVHTAGQAFAIDARIVSNEKVTQVEVFLQNGNSYDHLNLEREKGYTFIAKVPEKLLIPGFLKYRILVHTEANTYTFPGNVQGSPADWDFYSDKQYSVTILPTNAPVYLFNASEDSERLVMGWQPENELVPTATPGEAEYQFHIKNLVNPDVLAKNGDSIYDYSFRYNFTNKISGENKAFLSANRLILKARVLSEKPEKMQVAFLLKNGSAYGKTITLSTENEEYPISLNDLKPVKTVTLPRPYPTFLPYYFEPENSGDFQLGNTEALQFSIGPEMNEEEQRSAHDLSIISVSLK
ncbi:MAG TPA: hypothetical protein ENH91_14135 [Leeuwenhoekiella sp.]|nr:hypothetical protein [Leeuwenhoekiella sp.]